MSQDHATTKSLALTHVPHPVLSSPTQHIMQEDIIKPEMQHLIDQMFVTMKVEHGCGLAAPQVGLNKRLAVIDAEGHTFTIINPEITRKSPQQVIFPEGCLSIPGKEFSIIRNEKITVSYLDREAKQCKIKLKGFLAIVFQHEIDHLNGTVIANRFEEQRLLREEINMI